ncbi:MAG: universal stress protein [Roseibacillus sp.]
MKNWNTIVVAIDFSSASLAALREAARLANWHQSTLHVAHVIPFEKSEESSGESENTVTISLVRSKVEEELRRITLHEIEFFNEIEYHVMTGHPFRELCQLLEDIDAKLLVLGRCGQSSKGSQIGTIAANCLRKAPVSVLLIRPSHEDPFHQIVVATDFSRTATRAINQAAEIAYEQSALLHILHVYTPMLHLADYSFWDRADLIEAPIGDDFDKDRLTRLDREAGEIRKSYPDLPVRVQILNEARPGHAISKFIHDREISLVVVGTRGRSQIHNLLLGTTVERIIRDCDCSILAVKPDPVLERYRTEGQIL